MTTKRLSKPQAEALVRCLDGGGKLLRWPGGFWTIPGMKNSTSSFTAGVPDWYCVIATVRSLERMGLLIRAMACPQEWRDDRKITKDGEAMVGILRVGQGG